MTVTIFLIPIAIWLYIGWRLFSGPNLLVWLSKPMTMRLSRVARPANNDIADQLSSRTLYILLGAFLVYISFHSLRPEMTLEGLKIISLLAIVSDFSMLFFFHKIILNRKSTSSNQ